MKTHLPKKIYNMKTKYKVDFPDPSSQNQDILVILVSKTAAIF